MLCLNMVLGANSFLFFIITAKSMILCKKIILYFK